jgi:hypothetical protein
MKKKADIQLKAGNNDDLQNKHTDPMEKVKIDKINALRWLITSEIVDAEKNLPGCEPQYIPAFNEGEQYTIKQKIFEIIKTL